MVQSTGRLWGLQKHRRSRSEDGSTAESNAEECAKGYGPGQEGLGILDGMRVTARSMVVGLEMGRLMGGGPSGPIYQAWYHDMRCVVKVPAAY